MSKSHSVAAGAAFAILLLGPATAAGAQPSAGARFTFDQPGETLSQALRDVALRTGRNLIAPGELVEALQAPPLSGNYTAEEAVARLLAGTDLRLRLVSGTLMIERSPLKAGPESRATEDSGAVVVTGTRIRGGPVASPVIKLGRDQIRDEGDSTLAAAVRTIPQNFGGGQNPGVGNNVPAASGVNVGSSTSVNLRGLGSDATLTLVNGHRLSYSASRQAVDISAIPLGAVDRVEVVADGASALYGSDAVAGVVNVVLRRDYRGLETSARIGGSADGGNFEQRYGLVTGGRWGSGGLIATYEFGRTTAILGKDRSYTRSSSPALTLFPFLRTHNLLVSGHQALAPGLTFEFNGVYNRRFSDSSYALNAAGDIRQSGARFIYRVESFAVAPTLRFGPGSNWSFFLGGSYGQDHTHYDVTSFFRGLVFNFPGNCYCNNGKSAELGAEGTLLALPGGRVKLAAGLGYRGSRLIRFNGAGAITNIAVSQNSYFAYGELSIPLVSPEQAMHLVDRLQLSAALRYERYPHVGQVATPKLGLIFAPTSDIALKASWGKSFRAPTLYQQYEARLAVLDRPRSFGGLGFPASATALVLEGGNPDLKPERATSWSTTLDVHPQAIKGLQVEASYFDTRYRNRVVTPITFLSRALSDPLYADRLTFNPTASFLQDIIDSTVSFGNAAGQPYNPADVAVFIDNRNVNAGYQRLRGADLLMNYRIALGSKAGDLSGLLNATYLKSEQQLDSSQPILPMAGIIFHPPHFRARGGLSWIKGPMTLTGDVAYVGGVKDSRQSPARHVRGMTTADLTLRYRAEKTGARWLNGLDLTLTAQNLFNAKPARIATTLPSDAPYDSTNYSPTGRFVAAQLTKRW